MKKNIAGFILIFFALQACEKPFWGRSAKSFWIENQSSHLILTLRSRQYPDTTIPDTQNGLGGIKAGVKAPYDYSIKSWEELFDQLPRDTLSIFIFHADTLAQYSWQEIRSGYKILKRYDLSQKDLENMNWTIQYH